MLSKRIKNRYYKTLGTSVNKYLLIQDIITTVDGIPVTSLDFTFLTNTLLTEGTVKAVLLRPPKVNKRMTTFIIEYLIHL